MAKATKVANQKICFFSLKPGKGDRCQITSHTGIRGTKPQSATTTELMFFEEYPLFLFSIVVDDGCFWERPEARKWMAGDGKTTDHPFQAID